MNLRSRLLPLLTLLVAMLLASCGTQPTRAPEPEVNPYEQRAEAMLREGERERAASLFGDAAATARSDADAARLRLQAARLWLELERPGAVRFQLSRLPEPVSASQRWQRQLLEARLHLLEDAPERALALLEREPVPEELAADWLKARARALAALDRPLEASEALARWLEMAPASERVVGEDVLWALLGRIPAETLRERMPPPPDNFGGWLELAFLVRDLRLYPEELTEALQQWQGRYQRHPAAERLLPQLLVRYRAGLRYPDQVALLLPMTGELSAAAEAIHAGFVAGYYATEGDRPTVRVYDVGEQGQHAATAYEEAVAAGAEFVVGPLTKESLVALAGQPRLPVPVLALNILPDGYSGPAGLYQFGLAPEDEAWAAADYAASRDFQRALLLLPQGEWGQRVGRGFEAAFGADKVLETVYYNPALNDFSDPIRESLNLDASERRYRELRGTLRRGIVFEPYRRQDVDVIFLAAYPREGRLMRPQLRFFHAIDVPVLTTSHIFSGTWSQVDQDLESVVFMEMPWLLGASAEVAPLSPEVVSGILAPSGALRLHALGMDAYRLIPYVDAMREFPGEMLEGNVGTLSVESDGRVVRHLLPARFMRNGVRVVEAEAVYGGRPDVEPESRSQR